MRTIELTSYEFASRLCEVLDGGLKRIPERHNWKRNPNQFAGAVAEAQNANALTMQDALARMLKEMDVKI